MRVEENEGLSPATTALIQAMIASAPQAEPRGLELPALMAYATDTMPEKDRAAIERLAARDDASRRRLSETWDAVDAFQRQPVAAIRRQAEAGDAAARQYLEIVTRPVRPAMAGLGELLREGGDAARLALTTLAAAVGSVGIARPSFAAALRSVEMRIRIEDANPAFAHMIPTRDSVLITFDGEGEPQGERLFVVLELGAYRLRLGTADGAKGGYELPIDPGLLEGHRLVARWDGWPEHSGEPVAEFEESSPVTLSAWPTVEGDELRIPLSWRHPNRRPTACRIEASCSFAPGTWQPLGESLISEASPVSVFDYPGPAGAFPWPLRLRVEVTD